MRVRKFFSVGCIVAFALAATVSYADVLMQVDFSGSGGRSTIAATDAQVTTHANLNYTGTDAMATVGGSSSTGGWNMDGTGDAVVNNDLYTASTFGAPTRFDLWLGKADLGYSYTVTNVEIVVRAAANGSKEWDFMYRDADDSENHIIAGSSIAQQGGTDPWTTYSIDLTGETGLNANFNAMDWTSAQGLRIAFYEATGDNADNLQIDQIRLNGMVVPEPAVLGLVVLVGTSFLFIRRRLT